MKDGQRSYKQPCMPPIKRTEAEKAADKELAKKAPTVESIYAGGHHADDSLHYLNCDIYEKAGPRGGKTVCHKKKKKRKK